MYAADCGNDIAAVGTGLGAKINDNVQFRPLTRQETRNIKLGGDYPRYKDKPHNVTLARDDDDKRCNVYVQTIAKIPKGKELYVDYGHGYWEEQFQNKKLFQ